MFVKKCGVEFPGKFEITWNEEVRIKLADSSPSFSAIAICA